MEEGDRNQGFRLLNEYQQNQRFSSVPPPQPVGSRYFAAPPAHEPMGDPVGARPGVPGPPSGATFSAPIVLALTGLAAFVVLVLLIMVVVQAKSSGTRNDSPAEGTLPTATPPALAETPSSKSAGRSTSPTPSPIAKPSYQGAYVIKGVDIGGSFCGSGDPPSRVYINFDGSDLPKQQAATGTDNFSSKTGLPAQLSADCTMDDPKNNDAIQPEGDTTMSVGPSTEPKDPKICQQTATSSTKSKIFLRELEPRKTGICLTSGSGTTWMLYRSGANNFSGDGMRPDLTFEIAVWKS